MIVYPERWRRWRTLLVHDWLTGMRGGERVLEWLCRGFPDAPIYTLIHDRAAVSDTINAHPIRVSALGRWPGIARRYRGWLPLFPAAIERFRAEPADLVLSTSHCVAKGFRPPPGARHVCYCFTPMRYAWTFHDEYLGRGWKRRLAAPLLARLRAWDVASSARVDRFVTLSRHVRERIRRFYGRDADVVYPPVNTDFFTPGPAPDAGGYDLIVSALVPYKRLGLALRAYGALGFPLRIVGSGAEFERLRRDAPANVAFLGRRGDDEVRALPGVPVPGFPRRGGLRPRAGGGAGLRTAGRRLRPRRRLRVGGRRPHRRLFRCADAGGARRGRPARRRAPVERGGNPRAGDELRAAAVH